MIKVAELRNLSVEELQDKVSALKKDLMQYRFQAKTGKLERQSTLSAAKRDIARALTIMNELTRMKPVQKTVALGQQTGRKVKKK